MSKTTHMMENMNMYIQQSFQVIQVKVTGVMIQENQASVKNYGGFFIGRYEAGYPDEIKEGTIVNIKDSATGKVPVSKAGIASWNLVSQIVAKSASESMYNTDDSSKSKLVDSYAWDTTCKWLKNSGSNKRR